MSPTEALTIIDALANGIDPKSGELVAGDHLINDGQIVRALFVASKALAVTIGRAEVVGGRPEKAGRPWSPAEDARLLTAFDGGANVKTLADQHGRSEGGIASRLVRLGRVKERAEVWPRGGVASDITSR